MNVLTLLQTENTLVVNVLTLTLRLALGLVMLPHGAQKLLGWFGGDGFRGTMGWFTGTMHTECATCAGPSAGRRARR